MRSLRGAVSALALAAALSAAFLAATSAAPPKWDTYSDTWVGVDAEGIPLPTYEDVGPPRANKNVGIFYFLWVDGRSGVINDNSKILAANPDTVIPYKAGAWHWWGEPLLGYYRIDDPYVLRKHAQMLTDAGVDTLVFDSSNGFLHEEQVDALGKVYTDIRSRGQTTPQIAHLTNARLETTLPRLYSEFYAKNQYPDLWFRWKGKPLLLTNPAALTSPLADFFTVRRSWAWANPGGWFGDGKDKWPWLDNSPQKPGWHESPDKAEQISVAIAQHATTSIGRSYQNRIEPPRGSWQSGKGLYFTEQWKRALTVDPEFVFVTGWNEWIAPIQPVKTDGYRFTGKTLKVGDAFFVDQYSPEFSRDAEPARDGFGDAYYYQLVSWIRRYKGVRPLLPVTAKSVSLSGPVRQWASVGPEFRDDIGDPALRDFPGFAKDTTYVNKTGRNDIVAAKVAYDADNVTFYVRAAKTLTPRTDPNWMLLYIDSDHDAKTGWMGYDFVVNRASATAKTAFIERNIGGAYQWGSPVAVPYRVIGDTLQVSLPRHLLGITGLPATLDFKWADNCYDKGDWTDFTLNGDAAPNDRFNYRAKLPIAR